MILIQFEQHCLLSVRAGIFLLAISVCFFAGTPVGHSLGHGAVSAQEPLDFVSDSRKKQELQEKQEPQEKGSGTSVPSAPFSGQQQDPVNQLLPSVGPTKKKPAMVESVDTFDFKEFNDFNFEDMQNRIKENTAKIDQLYGTMPVGFPELQQAQTDKIKLFREQNRQLNKLLPRAAVESFRAAPGENEKATRVVYSALKQLLDGQDSAFGFDPVMAMEISMMLIKNGDERPAIYFQGFRAAYALQDFARAATMLKRSEEKGGKSNESINQKLTDIQQKWRRELKFRLEEKERDNLPRVQIETTAGTIVAELFEDQAPNSVGNFINLVEKGFYDGLDFHLVRPGLFSQTGDPDGNGTGGPGYNIPCECGREDARHHFSGTLSMATSGADTGGSQFFITHQPYSVFDGKYTAFGRVIKGMSMVYRLNPVNKTGLRPDNNEPSKIIRVTVLRKRNHLYKPQIVPASRSGGGISNSGSGTKDGGGSGTVGSGS